MPSARKTFGNTTVDGGVLYYYYPGFGGSVTVKNFTAGLSYVDTSGHFYTPSGRDAAKAGVVASVGVAF